MKKVFLLLLFTTTGIFSQEKKQQHSFESELKFIKSENPSRLISLSRNTGEGVVLWEKGRECYMLVLKYGRKNKLKRNKKRMTKKAKYFFEQTLENYDFLIKRKNIDCIDFVNSFYTYSAFIIKEGKTYTNSFNSHCGTSLEKDKVKFLTDLLYN